MRASAWRFLFPDAENGGQYSAVGLVLTAKSIARKSIARYDRISKDQSFAEYYLLGTLLSTICSAAVTLLFF